MVVGSKSFFVGVFKSKKSLVFSISPVGKHVEAKSVIVGVLLVVLHDALELVGENIESEDVLCSSAVTFTMLSKIVLELSFDLRVNC